MFLQINGEMKISRCHLTICSLDLGPATFKRFSIEILCIMTACTVMVILYYDNQSKFFHK